MHRRTRAREVALQLIYEFDRNPDQNSEQVRRFVAQRLASPELREFAIRLLETARAHWDELDRLIAAVARNWALSRIAAIDRSVIRLGVVEMKYFPDTPPKVALDQAIDLAKRYGAADSPRFVNGILDRILAGLQCPEQVTETATC